MKKLIRAADTWVCLGRGGPMSQPVNRCERQQTDKEKPQPRVFS